MPESSLPQDSAQPGLPQEFASKADLLVGSVYELLNKRHWGFGDDDGSAHPGACYDFDAQRREALLLKGTSQDPGRRRWAYVEVRPDEENGLIKNTFFAIDSVFEFRSRNIENAHHDRLRGKLSAEDLAAIRTGLNEFTREDD